MDLICKKVRKIKIKGIQSMQLIDESCVGIERLLCTYNIYIYIYINLYTYNIYIHFDSSFDDEVYNQPFSNEVVQVVVSPEVSKLNQSVIKNKKSLVIQQYHKG